jgi:hypothetical protein
MLSMSEPKKRPKKPRKPSRTGVPLHVWIDQDLAAALQDYLDSTDPKVSKTAAVESALRELLRGKGFWPRRDNP